MALIGERNPFSPWIQIKYADTGEHKHNDVKPKCIANLEFTCMPSIRSYVRRGTWSTDNSTVCSIPNTGEQQRKHPNVTSTAADSGINHSPVIPIKGSIIRKSLSWQNLSWTQLLYHHTEHLLFGPLKVDRKIYLIKWCTSSERYYW